MKQLIILLLILFVPVAEAEAKKKSPSKNPLVQQISRTRFELSRSAIEREIKDPAAQLDTFTALPSFGTGILSGIRVSDFSKNCLLPRIGLKDGDVIEMINGQPLRTPADVIEVGEKLAKARPGAKVRMNLRRGDDNLIHTYLLVD